ncbi:hypothetical protein PF011_g24086 [Phytophthora fragariae]|uniref:Uncharacterized protein n=1 Tax=Phytophthora fragariae TaxID=53985 RepID=A0A6A3I2D0_9STRA|nr:hypothetical protein PF011_g24086 [Phytophthora fragariae]
MRTASSSSCLSSSASSCFGSSSLGLANSTLAIPPSRRFQPQPEAYRVRLSPSLRPHPASGRRVAPLPHILSAFPRPPSTLGSQRVASRVASAPGAKWL